MDLLYIALIPLAVALIAGAVGFSGIAGRASGVAKGLFGFFLIIAIIIFVLVFSGVRIPL